MPALGSDPNHLRLPKPGALVLLLALTGLLCPSQAGAQHARIAIIIDDIGYRLGTGLRAAKFPGRLTLSVIPHSPNGYKLAQLGHSEGKEIMLHAPMSSTRDLPLGAGALTEQMSEGDFASTLLHNLDAVPHISGVNNHMGSRLTQQLQPMNWLMTTLKQRHLYFVDSRTSPDSLAFDVARAHRLPTLQRDVFLDHRREEAQISAQFARLVALAKANGYALGIGHPHPETLDVLSREVAALAASGVELVAVSALLETTVPAQPAPGGIRICRDKMGQAYIHPVQNLNDMSR